jgi:hypothetical protein
MKGSKWALRTFLFHLFYKVTNSKLRIRTLLSWDAGHGDELWLFGTSFGIRIRHVRILSHLTIAN